jgi:hypothetical protein
MMVKAPGLAVVLVANAVFCLIVFSTLASLVRTGQVRFLAAGFTVGAVLYLLLVRFFLPGEIIPNESDMNGVMVTTRLLHLLFRLTTANGEVVPKSDYIAFMWSGQGLWSLLIGLASALTMRRLFVKSASPVRTTPSDTEQVNM